MSKTIDEPIAGETVGKFLQGIPYIGEQESIINGSVPKTLTTEEYDERCFNTMKKMVTKQPIVVNETHDIDELRRWAAHDKKKPPKTIDDKKFWQRGVSKFISKKLPERLSYKKPITSQFLDDYFRDMNRRTALLLEADHGSDIKYNPSVKWRNIKDHIPEMTYEYTTKDYCIELLLDESQKEVLKTFEVAQRLLYNIYSKYVYKTLDFEKGWKPVTRYDIRNAVNARQGLTKDENEKMDYIWNTLPNAVRETLWKKVLGNFKSIYTMHGNKSKFKMPKMKKGKDYIIYMTPNGYKVSYEGINVLPTILDDLGVSSFFRFNTFGCDDCKKRAQLNGQPDKEHVKKPGNQCPQDIYQHKCSGVANKKYRRELKDKVDEMLSDTFMRGEEILNTDGSKTTMLVNNKKLTAESISIKIDGKKSTEKFYKPQCGEVRIKFDKGTGKYLLLFAANCKIAPNMSKRIASFDPGLRSVLTIVDNEGNAYVAGDPVLAKAHKFATKQVHCPIRNRRDHRGYRKRKAALDRYTKDYYAKLAKYLAMNYSAIIAPESALFFMTSQRGTYLKNLQRIIHHTEFSFRLKEACKLYGCEYLFAREWYTSVTCSYCGLVHKSFREKFLDCLGCHKIIDRDINGAKNMMIRFLTKSKDFNRY